MKKNIKKYFSTIKIHICIVFTLPLFLDAQTYYDPPQTLYSLEEEKKFSSSESIYLACEKNSPKLTIEDLLENNKVVEPPNKREKRDIKNDFDRNSKQEDHREQMIASIGLGVGLGMRINLNDHKKLRYYKFTTLKISKYSDKYNRVEICSNYTHKELNRFRNCNLFKKNSLSYDLSYIRSGEFPSGISLNRESLIYNGMQCYLSDMNQIDLLETNLINFLKPYQDELNKHVSPWLESYKKSDIKI